MVRESMAEGYILYISEKLFKTISQIALICSDPTLQTMCRQGFAVIKDTTERLS